MDEKNQFFMILEKTDKFNFLFIDKNFPETYNQEEEEGGEKLDNEYDFGSGEYFYGRDRIKHVLKDLDPALPNAMRFAGPS